MTGAIFALNENEILIGSGEATWHETPPTYPLFYAPDFFLKEKKPYLHFSKIQIVDKRSLSYTPYRVDIPFRAPDWSPFETYFSKFKQSGIKKAVPYAQKVAEKRFTSTEIEGILHHALLYHKKHLSTYLYGFWDNEQGMVGVTPELVASLTPKVLHTLACAGTAPIAEASLMLKDPKLLIEHQLVIQGIKEKLQPFGDVGVGLTTATHFSKIAHLTTPITLSHTSCFEDLIAALHPTPAIGTLPKEEKYLDELESLLPRGRFGAPFGALTSANHATIVLAIRNIQWKKDQVIMTAGAGLVAESVLDLEKNEIFTKFSAIEEILGIGKIGKLRYDAL